jgi:hypothetical protein
VLTNKKMYAIVKNTHHNRDEKLHRLHWFGNVRRMKENKIPKRVLYMNFETTRSRVRPRNRWQHKVREDGRMVGGEEWQERVYNREE